MVSDIEISRLLPHPENSNRMDADTLAKLRRHIERTGRYEPIVVRPHPAEEDKFQVINGHHRLQVLKAMGEAKVKCVVWDVDDDQTRLYLATLNRLTGNDTRERRAVLVANLLERFGSVELAQLLPENHERLAELERLARVDIEELAPIWQAEHEGAPRVILEFFLDEGGAQEVNLALDLIGHRHPTVGGRAESLVQLARAYLSADARSFPDASAPVGDAGANS